ncbi:MAG: hypothetical protein WD002_05515 [Pseudomonadales bacterium]
MLFVFGEKVHGAEVDAGQRDCGVCGRTTSFRRVIETNYFCIFGLRLLPIERVADYLECSQCGNAFTDASDIPAHLPIVQRGITYLLLGYGMHEHRDVAQDIGKKVTGFEFTAEELTGLIRSMDAGDEEFFESLRRSAATMNIRGKEQVIAAAFLMTHASCEIQYEDRLRINLMGNALGLSLAFVGECIEHVRRKGYFGVRRILQTQIV